MARKPIPGAVAPQSCIGKDTDKREPVARYEWRLRVRVSSPLRKAGDPEAKAAAYRRPPRAPHSRLLPGDPGLAPRGKRHVDRSRGDPAFLHTTRPSRDHPAAHTGARSPGVQNTRELLLLLLLQAQPWTFQFARDREAPPSGHDVHGRPEPQPPPPAFYDPTILLSES